MWEDGRDSGNFMERVRRLLAAGAAAVAEVVVVQGVGRDFEGNRIGK